MRFLSLFSGIGGMDLGLERAGMICVGQVEIDPYCRAVLAKHWPDVPRHDDVRTWEWDGTAIDLVCGGVPCQPASCAGKRKGAADERWLWGEYLRVVSTVRPAWCLAENVRGFLSLPDSARVFDALEALGYEVGTLVLGAHHVGAPHKRDRVWIVADAGCGHGVRQSESEVGKSLRPGRAGKRGKAVALSTGRGLGTNGSAPGGTGLADQRGAAVADAERDGRSEHQPRPRTRDESDAANESETARTRWPSRPGEPQHEWEAPRLVIASSRGRKDSGLSPGSRDQGARAASAAGTGEGGSVGLIEPRLGEPTPRTARRLVSFARRSALKALGNAVVPDVAEVIGRAILETLEQA